MHKNILTESQIVMLPLLKLFSSDYYLVGGTALALQYGHRRSLDFDLFTLNSFETQPILRKIRKNHTINQIYIDESDQLTLLADQIKLTFYQYEYPVVHNEKFDDIITMPDDLSIAAMKAFALGRRAKWKDYVDLYFVFKNHSIQEVVDRAHEYYGRGEFNDKLFRGQLDFHQDINYIEPVDWMPGFETSQEEILFTLSQISLS
ncbi:MAG: nucleotidyl transferase AbiEii/AbiGii toxin family protein [Candidatus Amesbacteria bacterium]|nr:nucleotidyl transferase AbiEii/AbiGii toxin family protein [Candidatus Amesbacteria bacterium]